MGAITAPTSTDIIKYWLIAVRPKTLGIAIVPVVAGTSLAWVDGAAVNWLVMGAAMGAAVLIQIGTNLHNDVADFERGADQVGNRIGPPRVTTQGWLSAVQVRRGAILSFGLAFFVGSYLVWVGGWPILIVGIVSIAAGAAYTGGPYPIAYSALGELFVCLFFGVVAVMGSYYLQVKSIAWSALLVGMMLGMLAAAVLVVNNYRDLETDRQAGKNTLAVRLGRASTQLEYTLLMVSPFALLPGLYFLGYGGPGCFLPLAVLPWTLILIRRFRREVPSSEFNQLLAATAQMQLVFGAVLSLGLIIF